MTTENVEMATSNKAEEVLATVLQKAMEVAEKTGDFVTDQAPDVVQQLLAWKFAEAVVFAITALVLIALCTYGLIRVGKTMQQDHWWQAPVAIFGVPVGIMSLLALSASIMTILQIWLAPKVYLIEYTANLLK